jgi:hypothetical protein
MPKVAVMWEEHFEPWAILEADDPEVLPRFKSANVVDLSSQFITRFENAKREMEEVWELMGRAIRTQEDDGA